MEAFLGALSALGMQLLLVVFYVGTLLAVKHLVVSRFFRPPGGEESEQTTPARQPGQRSKDTELSHSRQAGNL